MFPPEWDQVATIWLIAGSLFIALLLAGGPLLWAYVRHRPVTHGAVVQAVWLFVGGSCWLIVGNGAIAARERGLISLPVTIIVVALLFAFVAGVGHLLKRRYPDSKQS